MKINKKIKKIILGICIFIVICCAILLWIAHEEAKLIAQTGNMFNLAFQIRAYCEQNGKMPEKIAVLKLDTSPDSLLDNIGIDNIEYLGNINNPEKNDDIMFRSKRPRRFGFRKGKFIATMDGHVIFKEE